MSRDGLYNNFKVSRTDGTDQKPGDKHFGCIYFVLDVLHDKFAEAALKAYAKACREEFPELSADLLNLAEVNRRETNLQSGDRSDSHGPQWPACYGAVMKLEMDAAKNQPSVQQTQTP